MKMSEEYLSTTDHLDYTCIQPAHLLNGPVTGKLLVFSSSLHYLHLELDKKLAIDVKNFRKTDGFKSMVGFTDTIFWPVVIEALS
jgi:hypothetical protein